MDVSAFLRRIAQFEGGARRLQRRQPARKIGDDVVAADRVDAPDVSQLVAIPDASEQRAEARPLCAPPTDHHLDAGPALGLHPLVTLPRAVGPIAAPGDDGHGAPHAGRRAPRPWLGASRLIDPAETCAGPVRFRRRGSQPTPPCGSSEVRRAGRRRTQTTRCRM
jgi:hypothetical protein